MSRRATATLVAVVALVSGGCGSGSAGKAVSISDIFDIADEMRRTPYELTYRLQRGAGADGRPGRLETRAAANHLGVDAVVLDDYRYRASIVIDGKPAAEEVDADDARFLRLLNTALAPPVGGDAAAVAALASGSWVGDPRGAPGDLVTRPDSLTPRGDVLAPDLVLEQIRLLEHLRDSLAGAAVKTKWNPDAANYLAKNDHFPPHKQEGERFDFLPAAFDPDQVFKQGVPNNASEIVNRYFRFSAVWVRNHRITRIESVLDVSENFFSGVERAVRLTARNTGQRVEDVRAAAKIPSEIPVQHVTWQFRTAAKSTPFPIPAPATTVSFARLLATGAEPPIGGQPAAEVQP